MPGSNRISYRWVPNWFETCALEIVLSVARIELTDSLGVNTYTFEPRLPPVAGAGAVPGVGGVFRR